MNEYLKDGRNETERNDCTVIAIAYAFDIHYSEAYELCKNAGRRANKTFALAKILPRMYNEPKVLTIGEKRFKVTLLPRPRMTVGTFAKRYKVGTFIPRVTGHVYFQKDGAVLNCTTSNKRVTYFWKIEEYNLVF